MPDLLAPMTAPELLAVLDASTDAQVPAAHDDCGDIALEHAAAAVSRLITRPDPGDTAFLLNTLQGLYLAAVEETMRAMWARLAESDRV